MTFSCKNSEQNKSAQTIAKGMQLKTSREQTERGYVPERIGATDWVSSWGWAAAAETEFDWHGRGGGGVGTSKLWLQSTSIPSALTSTCSLPRRGPRRCLATLGDNVDDDVDDDAFVVLPTVFCFFFLFVFCCIFCWPRPPGPPSMQLRLSCEVGPRAWNFHKWLPALLLVLALYKPMAQAHAYAHAHAHFARFYVPLSCFVVVVVVVVVVVAFLGTKMHPWTRTLNWACVSAKLLWQLSYSKASTPPEPQPQPRQRPKSGNRLQVGRVLKRRRSSQDLDWAWCVPLRWYDSQSSTGYLCGSFGNLINPAKKKRRPFDVVARGCRCLPLAKYLNGPAIMKIYRFSDSLRTHIMATICYVFMVRMPAANVNFECCLLLWRGADIKFASLSHFFLVFCYCPAQARGWALAARGRGAHQLVGPTTKR